MTFRGGLYITFHAAISSGAAGRVGSATRTIVQDIVAKAAVNVAAVKATVAEQGESVVEAVFTA